MVKDYRRECLTDAARMTRGVQQASDREDPTVSAEAAKGAKAEREIMRTEKGAIAEQEAH
jgi:hypothetical protein